VAGRFPLYSDADVNGQLVKALVSRGWDVVRAVDLYPEETQDPIHFEEAARLDRVLVANDRDMMRLAYRWLAEGRRFRGLIWWPRKHYKRINVGGIVQQIESYAAIDDPFGGYPIRFVKPEG